MDKKEPVSVDPEAFTLAGVSTEGLEGPGVAGAGTEAAGTETGGKEIDFGAGNSRDRLGVETGALETAVCVISEIPVPAETVEGTAEASKLATGMAEMVVAKLSRG